jgi:hypothetical protein
MSANCWNSSPSRPDALRDADSIREQANELQGLVLGKLHDRSNPKGFNEPEWIAYEERVRVWHAKRAKAKGAA